ncbi:hypothetical protein PG996_006443 [Apiospora saccharicola]|uniref:Clr5 domain-containing protein n=1 Tax=Apiospora saccharicola TaxID=335842 RepID=A0ABR1VPC6_9PEZI
MASSTDNTSDDEAWKRHRPLLERLYVEENMSIQRIMSIMKEEHSFIATKHQFNNRLVTQWKCVKYSSAPVWKKILPHVCRIEQAGDKAEVFIDSKRKSPKEVLNAMARYKRTMPNLDFTGDVPILPGNVIVRAATQTIEVAITPLLPFYIMERQLTLNIVRRTAVPHSSTTLDRTTGEVQPSRMLDNIIRVVTPPEHVEARDFNLPLMDPRTSAFTSPLHRSLIFSIANNFAGLPDNNQQLGQQLILEFLKRATTRAFFLAIADAIDFYGVQALARRLFRAAVELGDHETVTFILNQKLPCIDINECFHGLGLKPIQLAFERGYVEIIKTMISFGAKVKHTDTFGYARYRANSGLQVHHSTPLSTTDMAVVDLMLTSAGAEISGPDLRQAIKRRYEGEFIQRHIAKRIASSHKQWNKDEILPLAFRYLSFDTCYRALEELERYGADLNGDMLNTMDVDRSGRAPNHHVYVGSALEKLAERFDWEHFQEVLDRFPQMKITERVVHTIIRHSGNTAAVQRILIDGPDIYNAGYRISVLKRAALATDKTILPAVIERLSHCPIGYSQGIGESFLMAALTGEVQRMKELLVVADKTAISFTSMPSKQHVLLAQYPWVMQKCIEAGHPTAALALVDAGFADDSTWTTSYLCLRLAVESKHTALVRALLDAGVNPNNEIRAGGSAASLISSAIYCDNTEFVQDLLNAGINPNLGNPRPLVVALQHKDLRVAALLLDHNASINQRGRKDIRRRNDDGSHSTALLAAINTLEPRIVRFALEYGADTDDREAIRAAGHSSPEIFRLVADAHRCHYMKRRKDWGDIILRTCLEIRDIPMFKDMVTMHMAHANIFPITTEDAPLGLELLYTVFGEVIMKSEETGLDFLEFLLQNKQKLGCWPKTIVAKTARQSGAGHVTWSRETAFLVAIGTGNLSTVELFLRNNAVLDSPKVAGIRITPFQRAVETGNLDIIRLLLDKGAGVNEPAGYNGGATALQFAAIRGYFPIVKLLLERGAQVDALGAKVNGQTALEGAAQHGRLDTVTLLIDAGAADKGKDKRQLQRAIQYAKAEGHVVVEKLLEDFVETGAITSKMGFYREFVDLGED